MNCSNRVLSIVDAGTGRASSRARGFNERRLANASFRGYADYMQTAEFAQGLAEFLQLARKASTTLMCAEAVWWRCHRSMVADALKALGVRVLHIMGAGSVTEHPFTTPARLRNGQLTYAQAAQAQG